MRDIGTFSVRYQRKALFGLIFSGFFTFLLLAWFAWDSWNRPVKTIGNFVGIYFGVPFGVLCLVLMIGAVQMLLSKQPALEISEEGISYKPIFGGIKRVFWSEVGQFTVTDQTVGRGKTQTFIHVLSKSVPTRSLLTFPVKDFTMPDNDELLLPVDYITDALSMYASLSPETKDISVTDKRITPAQYPWAVGAAITLAISMGTHIASQQANKVVIQQQQGAIVDNDMKRFDDVAESLAMFKSMKRIDPVEYERFRQLIREKLTNGATQRDFDVIAAQFSNQFMQKRLKYATPATLEEYLRFRVELYETIYGISPEALYNIIMTGNIVLSDMPEAVESSIRQEFQRFSDQIAEIIVAPLSDTPLEQNETLATTRIREVYLRLSPAEQEAFRKERKPDVDKTVYCQATLHIYKEILKLPENESVQVFRYLKVLPKDDRILH